MNLCFFQLNQAVQSCWGLYKTSSKTLRYSSSKQHLARWILGICGATGAGFNDNRWLDRIMKHTQMCALNRPTCTRADETMRRNTEGDWKCENALKAISLIIQLYIAKKLGSNCLTRLPASCFILIRLIGYLVCSPRLGILCTPNCPGSGSVLGSFYHLLI